MNSARSRLATRLGFIAAGFGVACWAPLIPFAKEKVGVDEAGLGFLLLCLGLGSIVAMPLTGWLAARMGSKHLILGGGLGMVVALPLLVSTSHIALLAVTLAVFGASLGTIDVAVNVHATEVERDAPRPLMSGFHAMFSLGGFAGAGGVTLLLSLGVTPLMAALCGSVLTLLALLLAWPRLLTARGGEPVPFALPRGLVLLLAILAGIVFLIEGAVLDWGALLMVGQGLVGNAQGGAGYMLFAAAMTVGRLVGDRIVSWAGARHTLVGGSALAAVGITAVIVAPIAVVALVGFVMIGLGVSNLAPVLFSAAGRQKVMSPALAVAAVTTVGYGGVLLGPAVLGLVAHHTSLLFAFAALLALLVAVPVSARTVAPAR